LRLASLTGFAAVGVSCGPAGPTPEELAERAKAYDPTLDCTSTLGLFSVEIATRTDNGYVERSPRDDQVCFACANFVPPKQPGRCASCTTVKGPINPLGWCEAFAPARS